MTFAGATASIYFPWVLRGFYAAILLAAAWIDLRERRIPHRLVLPAILVALGDALWRADLASALIGGLAAVGFLALPKLLGLPGIGMGDLKLAFFIGLVLGWPVVVSAIEIAALAGALAALGVLALRRDRRVTMPYGPFLALGALSAGAAQFIH